MCLWIHDGATMTDAVLKFLQEEREAIEFLTGQFENLPGESSAT